MSFKCKIEARYQVICKDETEVYHITLASRLKNIAVQGLVPSKERNIGGQAYNKHCEGKLFFTSKEGVSFWKGKAEDFVIHRYDYPKEKNAVPVVLKTSLSDLEHDEIGRRDAGGHAAFMFKGKVPANKLSIFYDGKWLPISEWNNINFATAFKKIGEDRCDWDFKEGHEDPFLPT
jgi:hypothetical protein